MLDKLAKIANILGLPLAVYCAYVAYRQLNPSSQQTGTPPTGNNIPWVFGILCAVFFFGGAMNLVAAFYRPRSTVSHYANPIPPPIAPPATASLAGSVANLGTGANQRIFVTETARDLIKMFNEHTEIRATKLVQPYLGKWLSISGTLGNVSVPTKTCIGASIHDKKGQYVSLTFDRQWGERLEIMKQGAPVSVIGKIERIQSLYVSLVDCELV